jgi:CheY-like chemotaxis protein
METVNGRQFPDLSFARVLVVDDMPSNLVVAAGLLKKYKILADCVSSGEEAVDRIKNGDPVYNAVLMDHIMPTLNGMETAAKIRALGSDYAKNIPLIAMTGEEDADSEQMFLQSGFQVYLAKPLSVAKLDPVLKQWIHKKTE